MCGRLRGKACDSSRKHAHLLPTNRLHFQRLVLLHERDIASNVGSEATVQRLRPDVPQTPVNDGSSVQSDHVPRPSTT